MSVRGERIVYWDGDRGLDRDTDRPRTTYTTIKRYQVPDGGTRGTYPASSESEEETIIVQNRKTTDTLRPQTSFVRASDNIRYRSSQRISSSDQRSRSQLTDAGDVRITRTEHDSPRRQSLSPERFREYRFDREYGYPDEDRNTEAFDVERYSRSTEYFVRPQQIVIRESAPAPIIIREDRREPQKIIIRREGPQSEPVEREEIKEENEKSQKDAQISTAVIAAQDDTKVERPQEDYFYERRIIERSRDRRRSGSSDRKSEIHPHDSASQYSSDDSYEYVRRERRVSDSRERSPNHKRHLAEGALAGIAAGEIIRHHKKSQGEKPLGRGRSLVGGAALGAVGAEALSRVRSMTRRGSRHSSRSPSQDHHHSRRIHRSRSRSKSLTRTQQLGGLAALAAVSALAGYAIKKNSEKERVADGKLRGDRSRHRESSSHVSSSRSRHNATNPEHRNRRIAQAGLATAAAAGLWEKVRSRSRGPRARSQSRLRQGVPIAAAGLGGAALAGLYEKSRARKEARKEAINQEESQRGRDKRSRSRSRSRSRNHQRSTGNRDLVAYGNEPIYPDRRGQYSDEEPGSYRRRHRGRSDDGSSPDTRERRSHPGRQHWGDAAAGGSVEPQIGGQARHVSNEVSSSRDITSANLDSLPYGNTYQTTFQDAGNGDRTAHYPAGTYFPPPPTGEFAPMEGQHVDPARPYPNYNPADYAQTHDVYNGSAPAERYHPSALPHEAIAQPHDYSNDRFRNRAADREAGRNPEDMV